LHPEFEEILALIQRIDISVSLFSNARWHNPVHTIDTLGRLPRLAEILISLHGSDSESHDAFTGVRGSFSDACGNIRRAVAAGLPVAINTIITSRHFSRVRDMIRFGQELEVRNITFSYYVTSVDDSLAPADDQLIAAIETIERQSHRASIPVFTSVCIPQCFYPSSLFNGCMAGTISLVVDPWGDVRPCVMASLFCGNILEQSLETIWQSEALKLWRTMTPQACTQCAAFSICHGGCRAAAMMQGLEHDPLMRQPLAKTKQPPIQTLKLSKDARPLGRFIMRPDPFGYILISGSRVIPVSPAAKSLLDACNGRNRLEELGDRFGQEALDLIALLNYREMIELQ